MVRRIALLSAVLTLGFGAARSEAAIIEINHAALNGTQIETFDGLSVGPVDTLLTVNGFTIGESFAGQSVLFGPTFEVALPGDATSPLTPVPGPNGDNLAIADVGGNNVLQGLAFDGTPGGNIAMTFPSLQSQVGFTLHGIEGNNSFIAVEFFDPLGGSLGSFQIFFPGTNPGPTSFGFADDSGQAVIAGMSFGTNDFGPVAIDDIVHTAVPEPATMSLVGFGIAAAWARSRRRASRR